MAFDALGAATTMFDIMAKPAGVQQPADYVLQNLAAFATQQYAYGQEIGIADPAVYAYTALGMSLAGYRNFIGSMPENLLSDTDFITMWYNGIFGHNGITPDQLHVFSSELTFTENLYAGVPNAQLIARGAVTGTMIGMEAEINPASLVGIIQGAGVHTQV